MLTLYREKQLFAQEQLCLKLGYDFPKEGINEKIKTLNETFLNIFNKFITNKISKMNYKKPDE